MHESEQRFRTSFDNASIGMALVSPRGRFLQVNSTLCDMVGYSQEELLATDFQSLTHPEDEQATGDLFRRILSGELSNGETEKRYLNKRGQALWVLINTSLVRDPQGQPVHFVTQTQDVTRRKLAEAENKRLATAVEQAADAIVITDPRAEIQYVNPAFTRITGYSAAEAIGQNPRMLKSGQHPPEFYQDLWNTILSGQVWRGELVNRRQDGSLYNEQETIAPIRDSTGAITNFIAVKQHVTARKQAEEEKQMFVSLVENSSDFIGMASFDGKPLYVNQAGRRMIGQGSGDVSPEHISQMHTEAAWQQLREVCIPAVMETGHWEGETQFRNLKTGEAIDVHMTLFSAHLAGTGNAQYLCTVSRDIRERKRVEQTLENGKQLFNALMDSIPDTIYFQDTECRFMRINKAQARMLGIEDPKDAIGKTDFEFPPLTSLRGFTRANRSSCNRASP